MANINEGQQNEWGAWGCSESEYGGKLCQVLGYQDNYVIAEICQFGPPLHGLMTLCSMDRASQRQPLWIWSRYLRSFQYRKVPLNEENLGEDEWQENPASPFLRLPPLNRENYITLEGPSHCKLNAYDLAKYYFKWAEVIRINVGVNHLRGHWGIGFTMQESRQAEIDLDRYTILRMQDNCLLLQKIQNQDPVSIAPFSDPLWVWSRYLRPVKLRSVPRHIEFQSIHDPILNTFIPRRIKEPEECCIFY